MAAMHAPESIDTIRQRKHDHRTESDELRMELGARKVEAQMLVANADPYLSRLELIASEIGPTALQTVLGLRGLLGRFGRQWDDDGGEAA